MLLSGREIAQKIFGKQTDREIHLVMRTLSVQAKRGKIEAVLIGKNYWYVTDGVKIFQKEKPKREERGRLTKISGGCDETG